MNIIATFRGTAIYRSSFRNHIRNQSFAAQLIDERQNISFSIQTSRIQGSFIFIFCASHRGFPRFDNIAYGSKIPSTSDAHAIPLGGILFLFHMSFTLLVLCTDTSSSFSAHAEANNLHKSASTPSSLQCRLLYTLPQPVAHTFFPSL